MFTKAAAIAAFVATVSAQLPALAARDFLQARQTDLSPACQSAALSVLPIYTALPTPPADLLTATLPSDPCATPTFTGSLSSEYASYSSAVLVWYSSNSAPLLSALAQCTELASYASGIPVCSTIAGGGALSSATASTAPTTTATGSATTGATTTAASTGSTGTGSAASSASSAASSAASSTVSKALAPRETGFVAAAIAGAAFIGAVAAM